jgi:hypothetical protein
MLRLKLDQLATLVAVPKDTENKLPPQNKKLKTKREKKKCSQTISLRPGPITSHNTPQYRQKIYQDVLVSEESFTCLEYLAKRFFKAHKDAPADHPLTLGYNSKEYSAPSPLHHWLYIYAEGARYRDDNPGYDIEECEDRDLVGEE